MEPAIFLDRDGVIIENRPSYVRSWADVVILPLALEAMARIHASPFKIVIVTNQSAVGRGLLGLEEAWAINHHLQQVIEESGGRVDGLFMCPHSPEDHCNCRKPKPGL
jgi:D-glycero-D-manno-heptose 1,7-bisphosphate phosphatase